MVVFETLFTSKKGTFFNIDFEQFPHLFLAVLFVDTEVAGSVKISMSSLSSVPVKGNKELMQSSQVQSKLHLFNFFNSY